MDQQQVKEAIFNRIKSGKPASVALPEIPDYPYDGDIRKDFIKNLVGFDGRAIEFKTREDALAWLKSQPELASAGYLVYSSAEGIDGNVSEKDVADLRNAHKINVCVSEGEVGVGETGSIFVTDRSLKHAACALLSRRLFIFLDNGRIKGSMQQAYASIKLQDHQYGSFFSGPSATADIEAVRITGAQGPLLLTAMIYNCEDAPENPELVINPNTDKSVWREAMEKAD